MDAKFIEYCINSSVISQEDLRKALANSEAGDSIYRALILSGAVSQEQLAIAAGEFYHAQVVDLSRITPDKKALSYASGSVCRRFGFLPFAVDPVVGLLVAVSDYTQKEAIAAFLNDVRVERMKFYIAPYHTLENVIQTCYANENLPEISTPSVQKSRRRPSILHTQYVDLENSFSHDIGNSQLDRKVQNLISDLSSCREENAQLRQRIDQLSATVELEASLLRELAKVLKKNGVLDSQGFERWLVSQR